MRTTCKWDTDLLLADEYLQSGLCPCCNAASMEWFYNYEAHKNELICVICGLALPIEAISHLLHNVEQFEHIVPSWVDEDNLDSWVF